MTNIQEWIYSLHISIMRKELKRLYKDVMRPEIDYDGACKSAVLLLQNAQQLYTLLNNMRNLYNETGSQVQGLCDACPSAPAEDDPA